MSLSVEELLKPRTKVKKNFPFNTYYSVGDILIPDAINHAMIDQDGYAVKMCDFDNYPEIFERLPWYAERSESDMPEYVEALWKGETYFAKVDKWSMGGVYPCSIYGNRTIYAAYAKPATTQSYLQYIESNK